MRVPCRVVSGLCATTYTHTHTHALLCVNRVQLHTNLRASPPSHTRRTVRLFLSPFSLHACALPKCVCVVSALTTRRCAWFRLSHDRRLRTNMSNGSVLSKVFDIYQHASDQVRMTESRVPPPFRVSSRRGADIFWPLCTLRRRAWIILCAPSVPKRFWANLKNSSKVRSCSFSSSSSSSSSSSLIGG